MKIGITKFPGTNNEQDVARILYSLNLEYEYIFPNDVDNLEETEALILAGGFSYGDYLRPGVIASHSPIAKELYHYINSDRYIIGICNGFQILCELGILPGILTTNTSTKFICKWVNIRTEQTFSNLLSGLDDNKIKIPIAHYEGRYFDIPKHILELEKTKRIAFRYCNEEKEITEESNPNGSIGNIAGILNSKGNVLGMMPHPERASFAYLGSKDGRFIFENLKKVLRC